MRIAKLAFAGSLAAIAAISAPVLAKSSDRQKADDEKSATAAGCQAYQQAVDGTWTQLPCGEEGSNGATQHRAATKGVGEDAH